MADDSFSSEDINALRQVHDHLVSTGDPRAPQLRAFLQSQNAMGPPPAARPMPTGITEQFGGYRPSLAAELTGVSQILPGMANLATGHPLIGAGQVALPALMSTSLGESAAEMAARGLEALPGFRAGMAGAAGLGKLVGQFAFLKPFSSIEPAFNAARASWIAHGPPPPQPLAQPLWRTGAVSPPSIQWREQPAAQVKPVVAPPPVSGSSTARFTEPIPPAGRVVAPPPVAGSSTARFAEPLPAAGRVVPAPPVTGSSTARFTEPIPPAGPVVAPPPVTGSSTARFTKQAPRPQPAKGGTPPTYPRTSSTERFNPPEEEGEGIPPAGPKKGTPVNPVDKLDRTALNATLHREAQDLDIAPVGGLRGAGPNVKVPSGFMDIVAKDKFGKPYRELSDDQLRQMINDRTLHNYKVK